MQHLENFSIIFSSFYELTFHCFMKTKMFKHVRSKIRWLFTQHSTLQKFARHIIHDDCKTYCVVSSNSIISASPSSPLSVTSDQNFSNLFFHNETGLLFRWSGIITSPLLKGLNSNLHHRTQIVMYSVFLALVILTVSAKHSGCLIIKLSKKLSLLI